MRRAILLILPVFFIYAAQAQKPLRYTLWADGVANAQLSKSALYFLGAGAHGEVARPFRNPRHALTGTAGYTAFFRKSTSPYTAGIMALGAGYRYASARAFTAFAGVGGQYWSETSRINLPERTLTETTRRLYPAASLGMGLRLGAHGGAQVEYRPVFRTEARTVLVNHLALSVGYTL